MFRYIFYFILVLIIVFTLCFMINLTKLSRLPSKKLIKTPLFRFLMKFEYYVENIKCKYPEGSTIKKFKREIRKSGHSFTLSSQFEEVIKGDASDVKEIILKYYNLTSLLSEKAYYVDCLEPSTSKDLIPFFLEELKKYTSLKNEGLCNQINNFLINSKDIKYKNKYLEYLSEEKLGEEKWALIEIVGKLKIKEAIPIILSILDKEEKCITFCLDALYRYDNKNEFIDIYKKFSKHKDSYIRRKAYKYVTRIEERQKKIS